ncbi:MAG: thioesterase family protein [Desulfarculaceae bacterium]|nr:thioesterase family protein [Desulfarculaceae bacterium]MCF8049046.1 thioesterase family protein [Desulfarculaceae bacterium]MCF8064990.1 thioesterase family protein [Desulfarculaceae bacterium]MCF8097546.1 thioesterase family protein [Desulfarculaceae bacterium]MCF8122207.1 thioesterase family protein [Desulfarculaceae bacterium]
MYPLVRTAKVALAALARPPLKLGDTSRINLRVWPGDLDLYLHMNNGRYLSLMDLGRLDLIIRVGMLRMMRRQGWRPLLAAATTRFWRSLKPFNRFAMETKVVWWDEKWIYLEQEMIHQGHVAAHGMMKMVIKSPQGTVPPPMAARALGMDSLPVPVPPPGLADWIHWEQEIKNGD